MRFTHLRLQQFRNYPHLSFDPHAGTTVLYGANGSGKTNVLEALHLLCLGKSHRTTKDREMIQTQTEVALIHGETERLDGKHDVQVRLYPFQKPQKRVLLYGKPAKRIGDMMGHATTVMFSPEDLRIVRDGPSVRRRFVDMQLCQIRPSYVAMLKGYQQILESRNALLRMQKMQGVDDFQTQLETWDDQLARAAMPIVSARKWFLSELSILAKEQYQSIAQNAQERFDISYHSTFANDEKVYQTMLDGLGRTSKEDQKRLCTSFGPHRDDMDMLLGGKELRAFGSQGQIRSAVLSLKLGEIQLIEREMGEPPTLLLDDVFSELDIRRRNALLTSTKGVQTILTCTDQQDAAGAKVDVYYRVVQNEDGHASIFLT